MASGIKDHRVVPHDEWLEARKALLAKEKEFTRQRSELSRQRRELPWHCDLARAAGEDRAIQEEDGMELQVGLFAGERLQSRSSRVVHPEGAAERHGLVQLSGDPCMPEREGTSVFYKDERGAIFHTYSTYARGIDMMNTAYHYLDLVPKGRDENPESPQDWVRHRDRYEG